MKKITESTSNHEDLDKKSTEELLLGINSEDKKVAFAVEKEIDHIKSFINAAFTKMSEGGRLFYIGAGTSGRLGVVDASECPPTFGVDHGLVNGIIAGGDHAIRKAVEFAEDSDHLGWEDLCEFSITKQDVIVGIAASGTTPYVIGAIKKAEEMGLITAGISCNPDSPLTKATKFPITPMVGPEFVTGSTRMKSGTAQKMVLNMISTCLMIKLGHVKGNRMVDMQLSNNKLLIRGTEMICDSLGVSEFEGKALLLKHGSVRKAINAYNG
ncbi:N-acetylmuramic acid 6-phosphate etherase [Crocinitomicaceae bacterium]|nr:N-acetylmuramic acid 6-phosphate etherase [Crocinitomicaceae bacterium]MDC1361501.1 N-acetylmuramic acid 6-phosphate etherase [Crocinitomicaceae bacterium]